MFEVFRATVRDRGMAWVAGAAVEDGKHLGSLR
jgi:hypothetical protein